MTEGSGNDLNETRKVFIEKIDLIQEKIKNDYY
jgi:hypothetical protein